MHFIRLNNIAGKRRWIYRCMNHFSDLEEQHQKSQLNSSWQLSLMSCGSLRPFDGTERTRKKEGREHGIERWWQFIFQEEGRHQKFITHGAKGLMKDKGDYMSNYKVLCPIFLVRRCFISKPRTEIRVHAFLHGTCFLKGSGLLPSLLMESALSPSLSPCLSPHVLPRSAGFTSPFCLLKPQHCAIYMVIRIWGLAPLSIFVASSGPTSFLCWGHRPWCNTPSGGLKKVE